MALLYYYYRLFIIICLYCCRASHGKEIMNVQLFNQLRSSHSRNVSHYTPLIRNEKIKNEEEENFIKDGPRSLQLDKHNVVEKMKGPINKEEPTKFDKKKFLFKSNQPTRKSILFYFFLI